MTAADPIIGPPVIALMRRLPADGVAGAATAAYAGGIRNFEITWDSDQAAAGLRALRAVLPDCLIAAGTLLTPDDVEEASTPAPSW